jgi:cytochrome c oxidase subunit 3
MSAHATHLEAEALVVGHSATVEHQFEDAEQQRESATLGMWTFLATEILFFGALFVAYGVYRLRWPEEFRQGSIDLKWYLGTINTGILLLSSYFMAMAVHASQLGKNHLIVRHLIVTMVLATAFVCIKMTEYYLEYDEGLLPGATFQIHEPQESRESALTRGLKRFEDWTKQAARNPAEHHDRSRQEEMFMVFYFVMTGIHATHMLIGLGLMTWLVWMARRKRFSAAWHNPVEIVGLYWHFVDTVWVFLFPILYLLRNP